MNLAGPFDHLSREWRQVQPRVHYRPSSAARDYNVVVSIARIILHFRFSRASYIGAVERLSFKFVPTKKLISFQYEQL